MYRLTSFLGTHNSSQISVNSSNEQPSEAHDGPPVAPGTSTGLSRGDGNRANISREQTKLCNAIAKDQTAIVRDLLNTSNADVNAPTASGRIPILVAIESDQPAMVALLLQQEKVDLARAIKNNITPLCLAISKGNFDIVRVMAFSEKVELDQQSSHPKKKEVLVTPLSLAMTMGHTDMVKLLLDMNANPDISVKEDGTKLIHMMIEDMKDMKKEDALMSIKILKALLAKADPNAVNNLGQTALHLALQRDLPIEVIQTLLDHGANPNIPAQNGQTALHVAIEKENVGAAKLLLEKNANPHLFHHGHKSPFSLAIEMDARNATENDSRTSMESDEDVSENYGYDDRENFGNEATSHVAHPMIEALLDHVENIDEGNPPPLFAAIAEDNIPVFELLLEKGANLDNRMGEFGTTALALAVKTSNPRILAKLLSEKADPNIAANNGALPLSLAAQKYVPGNTLESFSSTSILDRLFADKRTDPNAAITGLESENAEDFIKYLEETSPGIRELNLGSLSLEDKKIEILKYWAGFTPKEGEKHTLLHKRLKAETNFLLGTLLAEKEKKQPVSEPESDNSCATKKGALFHLTLALEQVMSAADHRSKAPEYAAAIIRAAPESTTYFNLNGIAVPRSEIENLAKGQGNLALDIARRQTMSAIREGAIPNVHFEGFALEGQRLLSEIQKRNGKHRRSDPDTDASFSASEPIHSEKLSLGPLSSVIKTGLYEEYEPVFNDPTYAPAIRQFLTSPLTSENNEKLLSELAETLLEEIKKRSGNAAQTEELARRLQAGEVTRILQNIRLELHTDPAIVADIEAEIPELGKLHIDSPEMASYEMEIRKHFATKEHESETLRTLALRGLKHVWSLSKPIDEPGFKTDTHTALHSMWTYIQNQQDDTLKKDLKDMLWLKLIDIGMDPVCPAGCAQRILQTPTGIDDSLQSEEPSDNIIEDAIYSLASKNGEELQAHLFNSDDKKDFKDSQEKVCEENKASVKQEIANLKWNVIKVNLIANLAMKHGWSKNKVEDIFKQQSTMYKFKTVEQVVRESIEFMDTD